MKEKELRFILDTVGRYDFNHSGADYSIYQDKDEKGKETFRFGRAYSEQKYASWGELMNHAKVESHYFKAVLEEL